MELNIRPLKDDDYETILVGWWNDWNWTPPLKDFLPDNGTGGYMILDGDEPICAGFIYTTNSGVAWVDWIVSSKTYRKKPQRQNALKWLIDSLEKLARNTGHKYLYALIKSKSLIELYQTLGFIKGDVYNSALIKKL